jgi:anti-anti-sigma factor
MSDAADLAVGTADKPMALGPELTIAYAAAAREQLLLALAASGSGDLHLDLGGVSDFDSSGVQLLLSAQASMHERGTRLHLATPSAAVRDALAIFGLTPILQAA